MQVLLHLRFVALGSASRRTSRHLSPGTSDAATYQPREVENASHQRRPLTPCPQIYTCCV